MLVSSQIIHNLFSLFTVNHCGIKTTRPACLKFPNPGDGFSAKGVDISIVLNSEWNIFRPLWQHDSTPSSNIQKGKGIESSMPDFFHHPRSDGSYSIRAIKSKSLLYLGMKPAEIRSESFFVNRSHDFSSGIFLKHFDAEGRSRPNRKPIPASAAS